MILKLLLKFIAISLFISAAITFGVMVLIIKNGGISYMYENMPMALALTSIAWALMYTIAPYAALYLWRLKDKGRRAALIIYLLSILYYSYTIYYYPPPHIQLIISWIILSGCVACFILLLLPASRKVCLPNKSYPASWFYKFVGKLKTTERFTLCISILALLTSIANIYFSNFYKPDYLLASVGNIQISSDNICFPVTFINNGRVDAVVSSFNIAFTRKEFLIRTFWGDSNKWYWSKTVKVTPEEEFFLKPGEMRIAKINISSTIDNDTLKINCEELFIALVTRTIDSSGMTHLKHNQLGKVLLDNGQVIKLKGTAGEFIFEGKDKSSYNNVNDVYDSVFRLH